MRAMHAREQDGAEAMLARECDGVKIRFRKEKGISLAYYEYNTLEGLEPFKLTFG